MKIHFYVNEMKPRARDLRALLAARAKQLGVAETMGYDADVVVALGGDGTILRAVHEYPGVPVLGLNLGRLGYLASVEERDFEGAIASLAKGDYKVSERTMLQVGDRVALNEVVVVREMTGHAATLDLSIDGHAATRCLADGVVVATPTGSTAYSLSAGGPVLMPDSASFVITPMNPHALGVRPMVVSDRVRIEIMPRLRENGKDERLGVYVDGESAGLVGGGEKIVIEKSASQAKLVELPGCDPYGVLAHKLGWSSAR